MQIKKINVFFESHLAGILFLLFFFSEAYSKYCIVYSDGKSLIPAAIKFLAITFFIIMCIRPYQNLLRIVSLGVVFCVGQLFIDQGFTTNILLSFTKFIFPILLFTYFHIYKQSGRSRQLFFSIFELILIINSVLIIMGFLFDIHLFDSYRGGRFGYNGLIISSSTASYVYTLTLFYLLLKYKSLFFKNWRSFLILFSCILIGTKLLYISILGTLFVFIFYYANLKRIQKQIFFLTLALLGFIFIYLFFFQYGTFNKIREQQGLISSVLSFRDDLLFNTTIPFIQNNWKWPNYLFGGIPDLSLRSQMGFIDVFLFWGILGGILYLYYFCRIYVTFALTKSVLYFLFILVIVVFLAGNFFENASVAIYLLILKERLIDDSTFAQKKTINE
ncbi:hypothetical protein [Aequorivita lipolytica]|uniref:O-antigen ligase family protein n=1 Tax=Aequorivita lipolytica TaxID=153267 RepID=A0A5C6YSA3_9FLAO|nr:hypothetical protein [Aequorivita lipolytica]TXD70286.1 hypothetical protein ESV24_03740 [Aequorivita lipolytica]SRX50713.1 hypothetical protein AEQU2_01189 [Aequorivita lipolytica]